MHTEENVSIVNKLGMKMNNEEFKLEQTMVECSKHGTHKYSIVSTIPGHEGVWCQICWIETLGPSFPSHKVPVELVYDSGDKK